MTSDSELDKFLDGKFCPIMQRNRQRCIKEACLAFHKRDCEIGNKLSLMYYCSLFKWELKAERKD